MKRIILSLVAVAVMMLWAVPAFGASAIGQEILNLQANDKQSTDALNHTIIDLIYVDSGSIVSYTYIGDAEDLTVNTFSVLPQTFYPTATDKLTRFIFALTNQYRPETEMALGIDRDNQSVHAYTYGTYKHEAMYAIISGIPDCLDNEPYRSPGSGSSWVEKYEPEEMTKTPVTSFNVTIFSLANTTYTVNNELQTMDVEPDLIGGRIYAPVRYVAYAVGIESEGIGWDQATGTITLTRDTTEVQLRLRSHIMHVNGQSVIMDAVPYIKQGRTMLPPRWVAEALGAKVDWDTEAQEVTITMEQVDPEQSL